MRSLIILVPVLTALAAVFVRDRVTAITVFLCYLTVEGFFKLASGYHPLVHIGADIVLWSIVAVWVATAVVSRNTRLPRVPFFTLLVLHAIWVLLLVFSPYTASVFVGVASLKIHLSMIPLYFIGFVIAEDKSAPRRVLRALTVFWVGAFALTLIQYVGGPDGVLGMGEAYRQRASYFHEWRPFGTTSLPGGQAVFAMIALPVAIYLWLSSERGWQDRWVLASLVGSVAVFLVSGGRQLILGGSIALLGLLGLQLSRNRGRAITGLVTVAVFATATIVAVQQFIVPAASRSVAEAAGVPDIWQERDALDRFGSLLDPETYARARAGGLRLVWDRVVSAPLGVGLGRTGSAASALENELTRSPFHKMLQDRFGFQDNFFAAMLVETGIPGTLLLTVILLGVGVLAARLSRRATEQDDSVLGALVAGYVLAMLVLSWGSQPLLANPTQAFFWFLGGMVAGRLRKLQVQDLGDSRSEKEP